MKGGTTSTIKEDSGDPLFHRNKSFGSITKEETKDVMGSIKWKNAHECNYCRDTKLRWRGIKKNDFKKHKIKCVEH